MVMKILNAKDYENSRLHNHTYIEICDLYGYKIGFEMLLQIAC
jgi:hypothetical protein